MKELLIILLPLAGGCAATFWRDNRTRPLLLPVIGGLHLGLTFWMLFAPPLVPPDAWIGFDTLARSLLPVVS